MGFNIMGNLNMKRKILLFIFATLFVVSSCFLFLIACGGEQSEKELTLSRYTVSIGKGEEYIIKVFYGVEEVEDAEWQTENANIAIYDNGKIKAINVGTVNITATYEKKSVICEVFVLSWHHEDQTRRLQLKFQTRRTRL